MCNAKKCGLLAWRSKRTYLCTKSARKSVFGYLVMVCLKYAITDAPILGIQNHFCGQILCITLYFESTLHLSMGVTGQQ